MALPTLTYNWQFDVNKVIPPAGDDEALRRNIVWSHIASLKGFASSPWVEIASALWTSAGALDWCSSTPGQSRSWILLRQTGIGPTFEMLVDLRAQADFYGQWTITCCPSGFDTTGTSSTVPPTPNGLYWELLYTGCPGNWTNANVGGYAHAMMSEGGESTWIFWTANGDVGVTNSSTAHPLGIHKVPDGQLWTPGWDTPAVTVGAGFEGDGYPSYGEYNDDDNMVFGIYGGSYNGVFGCYLTSEMADQAAIGQVMTYPDSQTGEWPMCPVGLACSTFGMRGSRRGTIPDFWWGSTARSTGHTYPVTSLPRKQFVHLGSFILPWNGTDMRLR